MATASILRAFPLAIGLTLVSAGPGAASDPVLASRAAFPVGDDSDTAAGSSSVAQVSADGRYVVFTSTAPNLAANQVDANDSADVFLYDAQADSVTLVSGVQGSGTAGNGSSQNPVISADGRYIAFDSLATDLTAGQDDANNAPDVFVYDRVTQAVTLASGVNGSNTTGDDASRAPRISRDGAFIAFASFASDLVLGVVDVNEYNDVFVYDRAAHSLMLASGIDGGPVTSNGVDAHSANPALSTDGRFVAFASIGSLMGDVTDTNLTWDVYVFDRVTQTLELVSGVDGTGETGNSSSLAASISGDGRFVTYTSRATNLQPGVYDGNGALDVYLYDRATRDQTLVSEQGQSGWTGGGSSLAASISADGRYVVFNSDAATLVPGTTDDNDGMDVFLYDRVAAALTLVSGRDGGNTTAQGQSMNPSISADGGVIIFASMAPALKSGVLDLNQGWDVYTYDRESGHLSLAGGVDGGGVTGDRAVSDSLPVPAVSADGGRVAFGSIATNLNSGVVDRNEQEDVFVRATPVPLRSPTGLAATPGDRTVTLTWQAVEGATRYVAYQSATSGDYADAATGETSTPTMTFSNLTNGVTRYYVVHAFRDWERSRPSDEISAAPNGTTPDLPAPTGLTATADDGFVTLNWNPVSGAVGYVIYQSADPASAYTAVRNVYGNSARVGGLTNGTRYYFKVTAYDAQQTSAFSNVADATPVAAALEAPSALAAIANDGSVSLNWNPVSGAEGYYVYQGIAPGAEAATPVQAVSANSATVSGLANGTRYYFKVAAYAGSRTSPPSNEADATPSAAGASTEVGGGAPSPLLLLTLLMAARCRRAALRRS